MLDQLANPWWTFVIVGVAAGVLSGALGVGGGIVFVPVLASVFMLPQKSAQGTALAVMAPMALVGAIRYWQNPLIENNMLMVAFLVTVAVRMFMMSPKPKAAPADPSDNNPSEVMQVKGSYDG